MTRLRYWFWLEKEKYLALAGKRNSRLYFQLYRVGRVWHRVKTLDQLRLKPPEDGFLPGLHSLEGVHVGSGEAPRTKAQLYEACSSIHTRLTGLALVKRALRVRGACARRILDHLRTEPDPVQAVAEVLQATADYRQWQVAQALRWLEEGEPVPLKLYSAQAQGRISLGKGDI